MEDIRQLRSQIRSLEAEMKQRLKDLRTRSKEGKANRTQIVKFINQIEGRIALQLDSKWMTKVMIIYC
jgi:uncharacterized protein involved in exopolysaccharide biosynthesis